MRHNPHAHIPRHARPDPENNNRADLGAIRRSGVIAATLMAALGALEWFALPWLLALHCILLAVGCVAAGHAIATVALHRNLHRQAAGSAGLGGLIAGLAYGTPFIIGIFLRWLRFDEAELNRRIGLLSNVEIINARNAGLDPFAMAFHTNQDVSYMFGYLLFGAAFGWMCGRIGAALATRMHAAHNQSQHSKARL